MSDQSRILLAIGGLVLGLALSTVGTLLLGTARAIAKHSGSERRRRADVGQYAAALAALAGFLLTAAGAGGLVHALLPGSAPVRLFFAAVTGVLVFAVAGVGFSRVADASEEARVRKMPPPTYTPRPTGSPATVASAVSTPAAASGGVTGTAPPAARPLPATVPEVPSPAAPPATSGPPLGHAAGRSTSTPADDAEFSTPPRSDAAFDEVDEPAQRGVGGPTPLDPTDEPADLSEAPAEENPPAHDVDGVTEPIADGEALRRSVRPGWIYRDGSDRWYLGVGDAGEHALPLLKLPDFTLVAADEPTYPLSVAGAGEIAVVPLHATADDAASAAG